MSRCRVKLREFSPDAGITRQAMYVRISYIVTHRRVHATIVAVNKQ